MSYYVRRSGATGWIVYLQSYEDGKRRQENIPQAAYANLGFNRQSMTLEQARERVRRLNKEHSIEKLKSIRAVRNYEALQIVDSVYLPKEITNDFQNWLIESFEADQGHRRKMLSHWKAVQKLIITVQLSPTDYYTNKERIFNYLQKHKFSLDYAKKLLRILNLFGARVCSYQRQFYQPVGRIPAATAQRIRDAYLDSDKTTGPSEPLTPQMLEKLKDQLPEEQYRWLYLTVWFGLRPREVDLLTDKKFGCKISNDKQLKVKILSVYQPKLASVARENRWKHIPVFLPQQQTALSYIAQPLKRPLNKTLHKLTGKHITCYGGRKGFIDLMLDHNQKLEDISAMMGHSSIEMSWRKYRNMKRARFTKVA